MKTLISLFIILLTALPATAGTPFLFAFESEEVFPYFMGTKTVRKSNPGATVEMTDLLADRLDLDVTYTRVSLNRSFLALQTGKIDGLVASYKPARTKFGNFPMVNGQVDPDKSLDESRYHLYVTVGSSVTWHPESLKITGAVNAIGAPFGYSIVALLKQLQVKVDEYGNTRENLIKLTAGRIDGAALLEFDADRRLYHEKDTFSKVVKLDPPLSVKPYYLMLSSRFLKNHPALAVRIWNTCRELRLTRLEGIMNRYLKSEQQGMR